VKARLPKNSVLLSKTAAEEKCVVRDALGPLQHGRGQPVARQEREHREARLGEQPVERLQRALVQQVVVHGVRLPPERDEGQKHHGEQQQDDLKTFPVEVPADADGQRRAEHAGQDDEQPDEQHRQRIKMHGASRTRPKAASSGAIKNKNAQDARIRDSMNFQLKMVWLATAASAETPSRGSETNWCRR